MKRFISAVLILVMLISCVPVWAAEAIVTLECEKMTLSGKYVSKISSPFSGVGFYGNDDAVTGSADFPYGNAYYTMTVRGASSNSSSAGISVYVDGVKKAAFTFSSTTPSTRSFDFTVYEAKTSTIKLLLETDNGSNDTYIDYIKINHQSTKQGADKHRYLLP